MHQYCYHIIPSGSFGAPWVLRVPSPPLQLRQFPLVHLARVLLQSISPGRASFSSCKCEIIASSFASFWTSSNSHYLVRALRSPAAFLEIRLDILQLLFVALFFDVLCCACSQCDSKIMRSLRRLSSEKSCDSEMILRAFLALLSISLKVVIFAAL